MRKKLFIATAALVSIFSSASFAQTVEMDCVEYQKLSGRKMPCAALPKIKVQQSVVEKLNRQKNISQCKQDAEKKYGKDICDAMVNLWGIEPPHLESRGDEVAACNKAISACDAKFTKKSKEVRPTVNLWD